MTKREIEWKCGGEIHDLKRMGKQSAEERERERERDRGRDRDRQTDRQRT